MDIVYSKYDGPADIQRKLGNARSLLNAETSQRWQDQSPLYQAYLEFSIKVFERDLAKLHRVIADGVASVAA